MIGMHLLPTKPLTEYLEYTYPELAVQSRYKEHSKHGLSRQTGIPKRTIQRWFNGQEHVWIDTADRFCNSLGIHPSRIWGGEW